MDSLGCAGCKTLEQTLNMERKAFLRKSQITENLRELLDQKHDIYLHARKSELSNIIIRCDDEKSEVRSHLVTALRESHNSLQESRRMKEKLDEALNALANSEFITNQKSAQIKNLRTELAMLKKELYEKKKNSKKESVTSTDEGLGSSDGLSSLGSPFSEISCGSNRTSNLANACEKCISIIKERHVCDLDLQETEITSSVFTPVEPVRTSTPFVDFVESVDDLEEQDEVNMFPVKQLSNDVEEQSRLQMISTLSRQDENSTKKQSPKNITKESKTDLDSNLSNEKENLKTFEEVPTTFYKKKSYKLNKCSALHPRKSFKKSNTNISDSTVVKNKLTEQTGRNFTDESTLNMPEIDEDFDTMINNKLLEQTIINEEFHFDSFDSIISDKKNDTSIATISNDIVSNSSHINLTLDNLDNTLIPQEKNTEISSQNESQIYNLNKDIRIPEKLDDLDKSITNKLHINVKSLPPLIDDALINKVDDLSEQKLSLKDPVNDAVEMEYSQYDELDDECNYDDVDICMDFELSSDEEIKECSEDNIKSTLTINASNLRSPLSTPMESIFDPIEDQSSPNKFISHLPGAKDNKEVPTSDSIRCSTPNVLAIIKEEINQNPKLISPLKSDDFKNKTVSENICRSLIKSEYEDERVKYEYDNTKYNLEDVSSSICLVPIKFEYDKEIYDRAVKSEVEFDRNSCKMLDVKKKKLKKTKQKSKENMQLFKPKKIKEECVKSSFKDNFLSETGLNILEEGNSDKFTHTDTLNFIDDTETSEICTKEIYPLGKNFNGNFCNKVNEHKDLEKCNFKTAPSSSKDDLINDCDIEIILKEMLTKPTLLSPIQTFYKLENDEHYILECSQPEILLKKRLVDYSSSDSDSVIDQMEVLDNRISNNLNLEKAPDINCKQPVAEAKKLSKTVKSSRKKKSKKVKVQKPLEFIKFVRSSSPEFKSPKHFAPKVKKSKRHKNFNETEYQENTLNIYQNVEDLLKLDDDEFISFFDGIKQEYDFNLISDDFLKDDDFVRDSRGLDPEVLNSCEDVVDSVEYKLSAAGEEEGVSDCLPVNDSDKELFGGNAEIFQSDVLTQADEQEKASSVSDKDNHLSQESVKTKVSEINCENNSELMVGLCDGFDGDVGYESDNETIDSSDEIEVSYSATVTNLKTHDNVPIKNTDIKAVKYVLNSSEAVANLSTLESPSSPDSFDEEESSINYEKVQPSNVIDISSIKIYFEDNLRPGYDHMMDENYTEKLESECLEDTEMEVKLKISESPLSPDFSVESADSESTNLFNKLKDDNDHIKNSVLTCQSHDKNDNVIKSEDIQNLDNTIGGQFDESINLARCDNLKYYSKKRQRNLPSTLPEVKPMCRRRLRRHELGRTKERFNISICYDEISSSFNIDHLKNISLTTLKDISLSPSDRSFYENILIHLRNNICTDDNENSVLFVDEINDNSNSDCTSKTDIDSSNDSLSNTESSAVLNGMDKKVDSFVGSSSKIVVDSESTKIVDEHLIPNDDKTFQYEDDFREDLIIDEFMPVDDKSSSSERVLTEVGDSCPTPLDLKEATPNFPSEKNENVNKSPVKCNSDENNFSIVSRRVTPSLVNMTSFEKLASLQYSGRTQSRISRIPLSHPYVKPRNCSYDTIKETGQLKEESDRLLDSSDNNMIDFGNQSPRQLTITETSENNTCLSNTSDLCSNQNSEVNQNEKIQIPKQLNFNFYKDISEVEMQAEPLCQETMLDENELDDIIYEEPEKTKHPESWNICPPIKVPRLESDMIPCTTSAFECCLDYWHDEARLNPKTSPTSYITDKDIKLLESCIKELIHSSNDENLYDKIQMVASKIEHIEWGHTVDMIVDAVFVDSGEPDLRFTPPAPPMTPLQRRLILLVSLLAKGREDYYLTLLKACEEPVVSFVEKSCVIKLSNLVQFHTCVCRHLGMLSRSRAFLYDILYIKGHKAYPLIFAMLPLWIEIIPSSQDSPDCLMTQTIIYLLTHYVNQKSDTVSYHNLLKQFLEDAYEYGRPVINRDTLANKLIENIRVPGAGLAMVLLCKREEWDWASKTMETKLHPVLSSYLEEQIDEDTAVQAILCLGRVVRGYSMSVATSSIKRSRDLLESILNHQKSIDVTEAAVNAICMLRRHDLYSCSLIFTNWRPLDGKITKNMADNIKTVISAKQLTYWKIFLRRYK